MATSDHSDETAQDPQATDKLTRLANVIGAVFFGLLATGALLLFFASGLRLAGGGIWYTLMFILATGFGYRGAKQLTEDYPALRLPIVVVGLGAVALACASWRSLGFEDPFVAPAVFAIFLMLGYFFTGGAPAGQVKSWKEEIEEQLAEPEVAEEAPAISTDVTAEAPAIADSTPASVTIYRMSKMMGSEVTYYISCDGKPVAKIDDGRQTTVKIPAGNHEFSLSDEYGKGSKTAFNVSLAPDEEIFIDCTFRSLWSGAVFKTVPPAEARQDMEGLVAAT